MRLTEEQHRRMVAATGVAMRDLAIKLRCPKCGRKMVLSRFTQGGFSYSECRWRSRGLCDYIRPLDS